MRGRLIAAIALTALLLNGCVAPLLIETAVAGGGLYGISQANQSGDKMKQATAAQLHVAMQDVSLSDVHHGGTTDSWTATAHGGSYTCSSTKMIENTTCAAWRREEAPAAHPQIATAQTEAIPAKSDAAASTAKKPDPPSSSPKKRKRHHHAPLPPQ